MLLLLAVILSAAADVDLSPLLGAWVNPEYGGTRKVPKFVYLADGILESYGATYAAEPSMVWTYTIEEAWQDSEGAYWYKNVATLRSADSRLRVLYRLVWISPDGTTYEDDCIRVNHQEFPTEINPKSYFYKILYRE